MPKISLKVVSPEGILIDEKVFEIVASTKAGQITILPNHAPLISELAYGEIIIKALDKERIILVFGGFIHIEEGSKVVILADVAEHLHEILEKEAEEARKRAEELVKEVRDDKERFAEAQAELARSLSRLKLVRKHRKKNKI